MEYGFNVRWSNEDEGFIATCPSFPSLSAFGESRAEALAEAEEALALYVEEFEEEGVTLPDPVEVQAFSGQFRLRLPKSLHAALSRRAEFEGVPMNTLVITLIAGGLAQKNVSSSWSDALE